MGGAGIQEETMAAFEPCHFHSGYKAAYMTEDMVPICKKCREERGAPKIFSLAVLAQKELAELKGLEQRIRDQRIRDDPQLDEDNQTLGTAIHMMRESKALMQEVLQNVQESVAQNFDKLEHAYRDYVEETLRQPVRKSLLHKIAKHRAVVEQDYSAGKHLKVIESLQLRTDIEHQFNEAQALQNFFTTLASGEVPAAQDLKISFCDIGKVITDMIIKELAVCVTLLATRKDPLGHELLLDPLPDPILDTVPDLLPKVLPPQAPPPSKDLPQRPSEPTTSSSSFPSAPSVTSGPAQAQSTVQEPKQQVSMSPLSSISSPFEPSPSPLPIPMPLSLSPSLPSLAQPALPSLLVSPVPVLLSEGKLHSQSPCSQMQQLPRLSQLDILLPSLRSDPTFTATISQPQLPTPIAPQSIPIKTSAHLCLSEGSSTIPTQVQSSACTAHPLQSSQPQPQSCQLAPPMQQPQSPTTPNTQPAIHSDQETKLLSAESIQTIGRSPDIAQKSFIPSESQVHTIAISATPIQQQQLGQSQIAVSNSLVQRPTALQQPLIPTQSQIETHMMQPQFAVLPLVPRTQHRHSTSCSPPALKSGSQAEAPAQGLAQSEPAEDPHGSLKLLSDSRSPLRDQPEASEQPARNPLSHIKPFPHQDSQKQLKKTGGKSSKQLQALRDSAANRTPGTESRKSRSGHGSHKVGESQTLGSLGKRPRPAAGNVLNHVQPFSRPRVGSPFDSTIAKDLLDPADTTDPRPTAEMLVPFRAAKRAAIFDDREESAHGTETPKLGPYTGLRLVQRKSEETKAGDREVAEYVSRTLNGKEDWRTKAETIIGQLSRKQGEVHKLEFSGVDITSGLRRNDQAIAFVLKSLRAVGKLKFVNVINTQNSLNVVLDAVQHIPELGKLSFEDTNLQSLGTLIDLVTVSSKRPATPGRVTALGFSNCLLYSVMEGNANEIGDLITRGGTLQTLKFKKCSLADHDMLALQTGLEANHTLSTLDLSGNEITVAGLIVLLQSCAHNEALRHLLLKETKVSFDQLTEEHQRLIQQRAIPLSLYID